MLKPRYRLLLLLTSLASLLAVACPFDERVLQPQKLDFDASAGGADAGAGGEQSEGGAAGSVDGGAAGAIAGGAAGATGVGEAGTPGGGSAGTSGSGGSSGSGGRGGTGGTGGTGPIVGPNMLLNGGFTSDTASWVPAANTALAWTATNAPGTGTGSLAVTNNVSGGSDSSFLTGGGQCVAVIPNTSYYVTAEGYLAAGQAGGASAKLNLWYYSGADCTGTLAADGTPPSFTGIGAWYTLTQTVTVPAGVASMLVRLVVSKKYTDPAVTALFDNAQVIKVE